MRKTFWISCLLALLCLATVCQAEQPHLTPAQGDNGLWGYKNEVGEWVFDPQWRYAGIFREGVAVVEWDRVDEESPYTAGILREDGTWILPRSDYQIYDRFYYKDDLDMVNPEDKELIGGREAGFLWIVTSTKEELMGLYLISTDTLMMPCWNEVLFSMNPEDNVIFPVCDPETYLWGYVDWYGEVVIPCQYEYADCFIGGYASVATETEAFVIDLEGNPVDVKATLESVEEIRKEGLQVTLAAQVRIETDGAGPVKAFHFFEETPIDFSEEPMEGSVWFNEATWHTHYTHTPLTDGVHTLLLKAPWGIDYEKYLRQGRLAAQVNCGAWVDVEIVLSK
ncbi:MAG: WG repeat-containing protein [Clostridia bacterium]|nr:WG repeat-containing protein [Clostridia bacterium]